jgi:hypothetical protein
VAASVQPSWNVSDGLFRISTNDEVAGCRVGRNPLDSAARSARKIALAFVARIAAACRVDREFHEDRLVCTLGQAWRGHRLQLMPIWLKTLSSPMLKAEA